MILSTVYIQIFVLLQNYMQTVNLLYTNEPQCFSHTGCAVAILYNSGLLDQLWKTCKGPLGKYENTIWLFKASNTCVSCPVDNASCEAEHHCTTMAKLSAPDNLLFSWFPGLPVQGRCFGALSYPKFSNRIREALETCSETRGWTPVVVEPI